MLNKLFTLIVVMFSPMLTMAQENKVDMADTLYENGKIYVVLIVALIVFLVFLGYLIKVDMKVNKVFKEIDKRKETE